MAEPIFERISSRAHLALNNQEEPREPNHELGTGGQIQKAAVPGAQSIRGHLLRDRTYD